MVTDYSLVVYTVLSDWGGGTAYGRLAVGMPFYCWKIESPLSTLALSAGCGVETVEIAIDTG
jgi:hypothetical protein